MANAVSKEEVKNFLILFRKEMEARIAASYATFPTVNTVKGDLDTLEDKVGDIVPPTNSITFSSILVWPLHTHLF